LILNFDAESTDYIRFNKAKIRQAGNVKQNTITLKLINKKGKTLNSVTRISGELQNDLKTLDNVLNFLKRELSDLPPDKYLTFSHKNNSSEKIYPDKKINNMVITQNILDSFINLDMVGILSSGTICAGFANSKGQINWHENQSFNFDWSIYNKSGKAIKQNYSDIVWNNKKFSKILEEGKEKLKVLNYKEVKINPGAYKVYLSPNALYEIIEILGWGGFSFKSNKVGTSPLHLMTKSNKSLHESINISENLSSGIAPNFQADGFIKPENTDLIVNGKYINSLVSPRSSLEYVVKHNAAENHESPISLTIKPGSIGEDNILSTLKDGIYINNLWYLNFSDRNNGKITGLTRFGCFKIKDGEYEGPINSMRFDETIYNILGENLIGLTDTPHLLMDNSTYEQRSNYSAFLPGAVVDDFRMTL